MKKLFLIFTLSVTPMFAQSKEKALHIMYQNTDSTYFTEDGVRWNEFTLPLLRAYKVMDLMEADTTCDCDIIKGHKNYMRYLKDNQIEKVKKYDKKVIGHLDCMINDSYVLMWMTNDDAFGMIAQKTLN